MRRWRKTRTTIATTMGMLNTVLVKREDCLIDRTYAAASAIVILPEFPLSAGFWQTPVLSSAAHVLDEAERCTRVGAREASIVVRDARILDFD